MKHNQQKNADAGSVYRVRSRYRIYPTEHSKLGKAALAVSQLLILAFIVLIGVASWHGGNVSIYYGCAGIGALTLAVISLLAALISRKERRSFKLYPNLAAASSLVACFLWGGLFALGYYM